MKHFILMSDIIESRQKPQNILISNFKKCTKHINDKFRKKMVSPLTITLGDEFQGLILDLKSAIQIILEIEEFIIENNLQMKLRYVLYYGEIETNINNKIAFEMLGSGLSTARNTLIKLKKQDNRFYIDISNETKNIILNNSFKIYQNILDRWKVNLEYKLISSFIKEQDYKVVSEKLNKNRSLMWKREKSLNISSYFSTKEILIATTNI